MKNFYIGFIYLIAFIILGYSREFFFVHLNNILYLKYYGHSSLTVPSVMSGFNSWSYETIYWSKYVFTLISLALFFCLNYLAVLHISQQKKVAKFISYTYLLLLILAAISMGIGYFINGRLQDDEYTLSRWLLGILQSPIPALFFLATQKLIFTSKSS
jgi:hypothetical protein